MSGRHQGDNGTPATRRQAAGPRGPGVLTKAQIKERFTLPWEPGAWQQEIMEMVEYGGWGLDGTTNSNANITLERAYLAEPLSRSIRDLLHKFVIKHLPILKKLHARLNGQAHAQDLDPSLTDTKRNGTAGGLKLRNLASVEPKQVKWLWQDRIPYGMLSEVNGNPDQGKGFVTMDIIARHSRGWRMPPLGGDDADSYPGHVLVMSAEDDTEHTIVPRLIAAGADRSRVHQLDDVDGRLPVLPDDADRIEQEALRLGVKLIVIDPLAAFISGKVDSHKDHESRRVLHRLKVMAERTGAAVLSVRHLNKCSNEKEPIFRTGGSIAFTAAARSSLLIGRHPDDPGLHVIARIKCNLGKTPPHLGYRIQPTADGSARLEWLPEEIDIEPFLLLGHHGGQRGEKREAAKDFLRLALANGPRKENDIEAEAKHVGIKPATLRRAKEELGIVAIPPIGRGGPWFWRMSDQDPASPVPPVNGEQDLPKPHSECGPGSLAHMSKTSAPNGQGLHLWSEMTQEEADRARADQNNPRNP